ncbi:2142_t:CDS:2 [Acaulospora morrowiae]|uniref:2142_t:CDS:1 n=1 Tax=Acaulospora morrowiae TaxID=94023 RepID=A0A9N8VSL2_9GLOM|nr:2142_t:CDS:2 [Acaulospora morrowiae]
MYRKSSLEGMCPIVSTLRERSRNLSWDLRVIYLRIQDSNAEEIKSRSKSRNQSLTNTRCFCLTVAFYIKEKGAIYAAGNE